MGMRFAFWSAPTPALSPRRGRNIHLVLGGWKRCFVRSASSLNYQPVARCNLTLELLNPRDCCSLSPGGRVRVRAGVTLTFPFPNNPRPCASRQRMRRAFLQRIENHIAHKLFLSSQLPIPEAKLLDPHRSEELCPLGIVSLLVGKTMLPTIEFNREACFYAIEVEEVNPAWMIAAKLVRAEPPVAQPTPHRLLGPSLLLAQRTSAFRVGHSGRLGCCARFEKNSFDARPHPGPLPQERENHSPASRVTKFPPGSIIPRSELASGGEMQPGIRIIGDARKPSPPPGGGGQGEGERHTISFGEFEKLVFTIALTPALSPRRGRIVRNRSSLRKSRDYSAASLQLSKSKAGGHE